MNEFAQIRERYRLHQAEWAAAFGVSRSAVSSWETGGTLPPAAALAAYRRLQDPIRRGDLHAIEEIRGELLAIGRRAADEAERMNRARGTGPTWVDVIAVTAGAVAIGLLLGYLFRDAPDRRG